MTTYTTCEDGHRSIRRARDKSIVAHLMNPRQYWDGQKVCAVPLNLDHPTLLGDSKRFYLFLPYHAPIPLFEKKKMEEINKLLLQDYISTVEGVYDTYRRFVVVARVYSGTAKGMTVMNVGSIFFSIAFPHQHYSLILSLVSNSLNSMFSVDSRRQVLSRIVDLYSDRIIPEVEKVVYERIGWNVKDIKTYVGDTEDTTDYLVEKRKIDYVVDGSFRRFMGEAFTVPVGLKYIDLTGIGVCIFLYISMFVLVPVMHWWISQSR